MIIKVPPVPKVLHVKLVVYDVLQPKPSKLTDLDNTWHVWGTGRMVGETLPNLPILRLYYVMSLIVFSWLALEGSILSL